MRASEFLIEYKLKVSKDADGVSIKATAGGKQLGHAEFFFDEQGRLDPQTVWVDERYHGQGIARDMYDHLKGLGYTIVRSWDQTDAGRGFWDKHRGEDARVWEGSNQTQLPGAIKQFLHSLTPSDVGVEKIGNYHVHFEGFTDDCKSSSDYCANPEAVYQEVFNDFVQREGGQQPIASGMIGDEDYPVLYSVFRVRSSKQVNEISDERLQDYLSRAGRRVDSRLERMARARQRLDKGYEIYHAEDPDRVVHKFEANTPQLAQRYYQDYIERYESDVDYDLRLRRATGLEENFADGKKPGRKGLAKRVGVNCKQSISKLRKIAKNSSGERARMAHWCANMKAGKKK